MDNGDDSVGLHGVLRGGGDRSTVVRKRDGLFLYQFLVGMSSSETKGNHLDPEKGRWAPMLWKFFHGIIERASQQDGGARIGTCGMKEDEARETYWLLQHMETVIPCARCRIHAIEYKKKHPLIHSGAFQHQGYLIRGFEKEALRKWVWDFHEDVNNRLGKVGGVSLESVESIYTSIDVKKLWKDIWKDLTGDLGQKGGLDYDKMREYNRHYIMWMSFSGA